MSTRTQSLFAASGFLLATTTTIAQAQSASEAGAAASDAERWSVEEIVVTARRRTESLQDVPQTVNAVTSDTLEKLNVLDFEDVQALVPGLTLTGGSTGYTTAATIRGAAFQVESGATPTVEFYLNDAPIQSNFLFQSMYDVGQIEVLRGPQGTLRGRASPSGSITVTTRQADLSEFGGYLNMTATNQEGHNAHGAVNLPIVADKLALRIAGIFDENDYDQVRSINNTGNPSQRTKSGRATLRFEPNDAISATLMYQWLDRKLHSFEQYQSFSVAEPTAPVTSPIIEARDRLGITDGARDSTQRQHNVTLQVDGRVAGQLLSYVGSYFQQNIDALSPSDGGNIAPAFEFFQALNTDSDGQSHELRLASEERVLDSFDYTIGAFYQKFEPSSDLTNQTLVGIQTGATTVRPATIVNTPIARRGGSEETSFFGNLTYHLGDNTELSAGLRHIMFESDNSLVVSGNLLSDLDEEEEPTIYNVAVSHRFTDDFMAYTNYGTSWRAGPVAVGVFRPLTPRLQQFTDLDSETSKSYELGVKAEFLEQRLRVNLSVFHQNYSDFLYRGPSVYYVDINQAGERPATFNFVANVDAKVNGAELDLAFQATRHFSIGTSVSYAKGEIEDGIVPCNDFNGDGRPDNNPPAPTVAQIRAAAGGEEVGACRVDDRLSFAPDWSATLQPEFALPINSSMDAFVRGLYTYYAENERDPNNSYDNVNAYGLLNLYAGIRSNDGAWEVSLFAKNVTETGEILAASNGPTTTNYQRLLPPTFRTSVGASLSSGYMNDVRYTPPREIGLNVRYAFGSR